MIVRMASDVHLRDAGYAARGSLHDIVGVFVRVSCPTETARPTETENLRVSCPTETDRDKQTHTLRAGGFEREAL